MIEIARHANPALFNPDTPSGVGAVFDQVIFTKDRDRTAGLERNTVGQFIETPFQPRVLAFQKAKRFRFRRIPWQRQGDAVGLWIDP